MSKKVMSVRLTEQEKQLIEERAKGKGKYPSTYMVECALNASDRVTPVTLVQYERIAAIMDKVEMCIPKELMEEYRKEVDKLWQSLNS